MRAFRLLIIVMVVLFATVNASNPEQRSLRVAYDDNEERGISNWLSALKAKLQAAKLSLKGKYTNIKAKFKKISMERDTLKAIKKGESEDAYLARMGVKPLAVNEQGRNIYNFEDPFVQMYRKMHAIANKKKA